ncbi:hypothetical protein [Xenorhabdus khoisanae]|uniref:hypothetical protein n=1 Tax=Xenorhabdus khoisanae TaxID=880157 RepID=UPI00128ADF2B|nr:hypothetical protein [Xenorhabdus khoisanae]
MCSRDSIEVSYCRSSLRACQARRWFTPRSAPELNQDERLIIRDVVLYLLSLLHQPVIGSG